MLYFKCQKLCPLIGYKYVWLKSNLKDFKKRKAKMENTNPTVVTDPTATTVETKAVETTSDKTFTQAELDKIIEDRLAKAKKGIPTKEELEEFGKYKESLKTKEDKDKETLEELNKTKTENLSIKQENTLFKKGVNIEDMEFVQFKVSKMDGEFEENLEKFLTENPKYTTKDTTKKATTTGFKQTTVKPTSENEEHLTKKYKDNPWFIGQ